ncbi:MAG: hypothetical protein HY326_06245 [Chloroflexi bacterium]|nr:hypothetical protein [Chloroflexota bacterium]
MRGSFPKVVTPRSHRLSLAPRVGLFALLLCCVWFNRPLPAYADPAGPNDNPPTATPQPPACTPLGNSDYGSLKVNSAPTERPPEVHPDFNLGLRSYAPTASWVGLVDIGGEKDNRAPQLWGLFADHRTATFKKLYQVYDWDWQCNCRGALIPHPAVTLVEMATTPGEKLLVPNSGYLIGGEYQVLVLHASTNRITLKYTREDDVIHGYTLHLDGICVDPNLQKFYQSLYLDGRTFLPALRAGQAFGRARTDGIGVAIRDSGAFMDPRSRKDWWQGR